MPGASAAAAEAERPLSARELAGFLAMVFGMFMAILDIQIVASSLTEIQAGLGASADEISWVQTSYLIAEVVMIPVSGYLARLLSTRILFVVSAVGFTAMSFACAIAWNVPSMIVFRALQGFLGGAMIPTVFATSFILFPGKRRASASVLIGLVATMAPTIGPTLGGWLTQMFSWHWLFLINLVPGLLVAVAVFVLADFDKPDWSLLRGFDFAGLGLLALFLGSLEFVLEEGPRDDWFDDRTITLLAMTAAVAGPVFLWRAFRVKNPIVDLRAFADRNFSVGCLYSFILGIGLYGAVYIVPLFLARVRGYDSLEIGLVMMVTGIFQFMSAPIAGVMMRRMDPRIMLALGLSLFGTGVYLSTAMTAEWGYWELFAPQAIRGVSLMLCFMPINMLALGTLPPERIKNASGLYNLMRNLGGAVGIAVINTIITDRMALHWARLVESVNGARPEVTAYIESLAGRFDGSIAGDATAAAMKTIGGMVNQQATVMTFNDALLLMSMVFFGALLLMPLIRKPKQAVADAH